jgi:hypothetical protein
MNLNISYASKNVFNNHEKIDDRIRAHGLMIEGSPKMVKGFWMSIPIFLIGCYMLRDSVRPMPVLVGLLMASICMLPAYLWVNRKVKGMPVFPIFGLGHLLGYAMPLITGEQRVMSYSDSIIVPASLLICAYLLVGTLVWYFFASRKPNIPRRCWYMDLDGGTKIFIPLLAICILIHMSGIGQWMFIWKYIPGPFVSLINQSTLAFGILTCFALAYQIGTKHIKKQQAPGVLLLIYSMVFVSNLSLVMIQAITAWIVSMAGYFLGSRKIPWIHFFAGFAFFAFLHQGKMQLRELRAQGVWSTVQFWEYPAYMAQWAYFAINAFRQIETLKAFEDDLGTADAQTFNERASIIQQYLLVYQETPKSVPFFRGETYKESWLMFIPSQVSRIIGIDRADVHVTTKMLTMRYGLQTEEEAMHTTISMGHLAEAYANFGYAGMIGLGVFWGFVYGILTWWSLGMPLFSFRSLLSVVFVLTAFQYEWTSSVVVSVLGSYTSALILGGIIMMKVRPLVLPAGMNKPDNYLTKPRTNQYPFKNC